MNESKQKKQSFGVLWGYTKGYRRYLALGFLLLLMELALSFISPLVLSVTIDSVLDTKPLNTPWYFAWIIQLCGGIGYIRQHLVIMAVLTVIMAALAGALAFVRPCVTGTAAFHISENLRNRFYRHVGRLPFSYLSATPTGDLIQRATSDIDTVQRFMSGVLLELLRTVFLLAVGFFIMASLNLPLTVLSFAMTPVIVLDSFWFIRRIDRIVERYEGAESKVYTVIQENLTGARVVRAFGRERFEQEKFVPHNETLRGEHIALNRILVRLWFTLDLLSGIQIALITIAGVLFTVRGSITLGQYTAFLSYVMIFLFPVQNLGRVLGNVSRTGVAAGRLEAVLREPEEDYVEGGLTPNLSGDIVLDHVCFSFGTERVLDDLCLTIHGGETVAILGGTGSGKTTLMYLLQRLYDPDGGTITISGTDIRSIDKSHLRRRIGLIMQEPFLFSRSIRENLRIQNRDAGDQAVENAARIANIHEDILSFDQGYDTLVGERGVTLSGGQKQRASIARTILGSHDILIFDDALSAVDTRTDQSIRQALRERQTGTTTILISHRISTLMEANRILVLEQGRLVEQGSHQELMQLPNGIYRRVYEIQTASVS